MQAAVGPGARLDEVKRADTNWLSYLGKPYVAPRLRPTGTGARVNNWEPTWRQEVCQILDRCQHRLRINRFMWSGGLFDGRHSFHASRVCGAFNAVSDDSLWKLNGRRTLVARMIQLDAREWLTSLPSFSRWGRYAPYYMGRSVFGGLSYSYLH